MNTMLTADVAIVGAGIQGCAAANALAQRGMSVVVLERDYAGRHASGVNAGGVRTMGRHLLELPLAIESKKLWHDIARLVDDDCGFRPVGHLTVAIGPENMDALRARSQEIERLGLDHREILLSAQEVRARLPTLARDVAGGSVVQGDGFAIPFRTTQAFRRKAHARGARFIEGAAVDDIRRVDGDWQLTSADGTRVRAPRVINCAGAWAAPLARMLGDDLPIEAKGSMQIVTNRMPPWLPCVVGLSGAALAMKQFDNGTIVIGGGQRAPVDTARLTSTLVPKGLGVAASVATRFFPAMKTATVVRCWSGIEGFSPDGLPMIGFGRDPSVIHAAGFSAHGFQLGPAVGQALADLAVDGRTRLPIAAFDPHRFGPASGREPAGTQAQR
jgi:sarcosine oxidase subunit beta